jgi:hypothetical protein
LRRGHAGAATNVCRVGEGPGVSIVRQDDDCRARDVMTVSTSEGFVGYRAVDRQQRDLLDHVSSRAEHLESS